MTDAVTPEVLCNEALFSCRCALPAGHEPAETHECDPGCGGSWTVDPAIPCDGFRVESFPKGTPTGRVDPGNIGNPYQNDLPRPPSPPRHRGGIQFIGFPQIAPETPAEEGAPHA